MLLFFFFLITFTCMDTRVLTDTCIIPVAINDRIRHFGLIIRTYNWSVNRIMTQIQLYQSFNSFWFWLIFFAPQDSVIREGFFLPSFNMKWFMYIKIFFLSYRHSFYITKYEQLWFYLQREVGFSNEKKKKKNQNATR